MGTRRGGLCRALLVVLACAWAAEAAAQAPTIWSFLGIGSAQQSSNPAIAAAAKLKAAKHDICKKKKALQYLGNLGCSPERPEVAEAILAGMSDPDEPVRYEAVKAVLQSAGECMSNEQKKAARKAMGCHEAFSMWKQKVDKAMHDACDRLCGKAPPKEHDKLKDLMTFGRECEDPCKKDCPPSKGRNACCTPELRAKLQELAYGRDEKGCFLESSSRVRTAAEQALVACSACCGGGGPCRGGRSFRDGREMPPEDQRELADDPRTNGNGFPFIGAPCGCEPSSGMPDASVIISDRPLSEDGAPAGGQIDEVPQPEPKQAAPGAQAEPIPSPKPQPVTSFPTRAFPLDSFPSDSGPTLTLPAIEETIPLPTPTTSAPTESPAPPREARNWTWDFSPKWPSGWKPTTPSWWR